VANAAWFLARSLDLAGRFGGNVCLVLAGASPRDTLKAVRAARQGAIESEAQVCFLGEFARHWLEGQ
jgi:hypothetical protein